MSQHFFVSNNNVIWDTISTGKQEFSSKMEAKYARV